MGEPVTIATLAPATRFSVRGGDPAVVAISRSFGLELPREACRASTKGDRAVLWLGPDEWLLLAPDGQAERVAMELAAALGGEPASIVDISDRNLAVEVSGPKAAQAINGFNPLDLDADAFPVGMCTRTIFGKAEIVLWRTAPETFRIEVWRSFAPYVLGCLAEATREYKGLSSVIA
jgi:sarcosine oxidase subunit gamma